MAASVGFAVLPIIPSLKGFKKKLDRAITPVLNSAGKKAQKDLGGSFKSAFGEMEKAAKKARAESDKLSRSVETASKRQQTALTREKNARAQLERAQRKYTETLSKHQGKIEAQEKQLQALREQGKDKTKTYYNAEAKLKTLRETQPKHIAEHELRIQSARIKLKSATDNLSKAEKNLKDAKEKSTKASKDADDAESRLEGRAGKVARAKDVLKSSAIKTGNAIKKMSDHIGTAISGLGRFTIAAGGKALGALRALGGAALNAGASMARSFGGAVIGAVQNLGSKLMGLVTTAGKVGVAVGGAMAGIAAKSGFDRLSAIEQSEVKLKTFGINTEKAMEQANVAVKGTAYGLDEAATAISQLSAAGVSLGSDMGQSLGLVADTAAITGASMGEISSIYSKIAAAGKLDGSTLDQLQDRGVSVLKALSEETGKTQQEVRKMISDGKIDFQTFSDAMEASIGGAAKRSGDTVAGSFANVKAALGRLGASMQESTFSVLPQVFGNVSTAIDNVSEGLVKFTESGRDGFASFLVDLSEKLVEATTNFEQKLNEIAASPTFQMISAAISNIVSIAQRIAPVIAEIAGPVVVTAFTIFGQLIGAVAGTISVIDQNVGITKDGVTSKFQEMSDSVTAFTGRMFGSIPQAVNNVINSETWQNLKGAIMGALGSLQTMAPGIGAVFSSTFTAIGAIAGSFAGVLNNAFNDGGGAQSFATTLSTQVAPWIETTGQKLATFIQQNMPPIIDALKVALPAALSTFANDENFQKARDTAGEVAKAIADITPALMEIMGSGSLAGLSVMNSLLQAASPIIENVLVPAIKSIATALSENEGLAKAAGFAIIGTFAGGKVIGAVSGLTNTINGVKGAFGFFSNIGNKAKGVDAVGGSLGRLTGIFSKLKGVVMSLGAFFLTNPFGIAIAAIAAVVGGLTLFFTKTETGKKAWKAIQEKFKEYWEKYGKPAMEAMGRIFKWLWDKIIKPLGNFMIGIFRAIGKVVMFLWNKWFKPYFGFIGGVVKWLWNKIVKPLFGFIGDTIKGAGAVVKTLWEKWYKPYFGFLGGIVKWLWNEIVKKNIDRIKGAFNGIMNIAKDLHDKWKTNVDKIKGMFFSFKEKITGLIDGIKESWGKFKDFISKPFKIGAEVVEKTGKKIKEGHAARKAAGGGGKPPAPKKYARGGVLPGYTPGRDIYKFVERKRGMVLHLSGGEAIMRPEWVRAIGGPREVERLNRAAASGALKKEMRAKAKAEAMLKMKYKRTREAAAYLRRSAVNMGNNARNLRFASGGVFKPSGSYGRPSSGGAVPVPAGGGNLTLNNPTLKTNNVKVDAQQARVEALKKARENADTKAADKKALADLRADLYTTLNDDQVSQARGSLLKEQAAATEAAAKLANARRFNDPKKDIERLNLEKQVADARVISSAKQLQAAIAQEAADKKAEARQKAEDAASAAKSLADAKAELYSLLNPGEVGQASSAVQKASADVMAAADALRIAQQFGDKPEVIQRLTYEKQIADVKLTTAEEELRLAQEKAAEEAKAQKREEENKRLDHVKTIRDLEAEIASLIDKSGVGSAKSEYMKAQADAARAVAALKQAMRYGDEKETIERLKLEARVAKLKERAAKKAIAAAEAEAKAERAKERRAFFDNAADNYAKLRNLQIDIYAERNKSNDYAASVATYEKAMVDARTALRKYQNAVMVNANYEEIRTLALERQLAVLKANNAREDMLAEKRQRAKKAAEKQAEKLKELAEEQTKYLKVATSLGTSWERQANSIKAFADMFKEVGESAKKATDDLRSAIIDFVVGFTSVAKAAFEVDRTMQAVTKTRLEGIAKVKEAEAKLTKERTKQFKLMTTAASGLAGADKLTSGYFSTVDRLGGVFVTNADEMRKAQADLLVARAQAAYDLAKAEADEKKARLEYKKSLYEQVKATRLLNVQLAEYISKQMLVNGLNNRQTDALSQYFSARSDILQAESAIEAAREQVKFGQIARDAQKVQEGMIALSEAQSKLTNAQFKQSLYADEAAQAFAKLPLHLQLGMKAAEAQDRQVTANAIRKAIARGDFESANAAAAMSGRILNSYLESISGIRKSLDEFTTREANYRRENINYRYDTIIAGLDNSINALDLSASKALEAYQAQLDAANALKSAAETEDIDARRAWVEAARQSNEYALQAGEKSRAYNKHMGNNVTVNFEPDGYYSGEQLAKQLAAATDRIESVEVQLSGKKVSASDYFSAH